MKADAFSKSIVQDVVVNLNAKGNWENYNNMKNRIFPIKFVIIINYVISWSHVMLILVFFLLTF